MAEDDPTQEGETPLEQRAQPRPRPRMEAPQTEQEAPKERWEVSARKTINRAIGAAIGIGLTGGYSANLLWIPSLFTAGGSAVRLAKGDNVKDVLDDALVTMGAVGTVLPGVMELWNYTVPAIQTVTLGGKLTQAAYIGGVINPAFAASYHTVEHLYKNDFSPQGLGQHLSEHVIPSTIRNAWAFPAFYLAPYMPNVNVPQVIQNYIPAMPEQIPTFAANALFASALPPPKTTSEKKALKLAKRQEREAAMLAQQSNPGDDYQKSPAGQQQQSA